jgi:GTPase
MKGILITIREDTAEIEELLRTLGHEILETISQNRNSPDPRYFLGKGKVEEVADLVDDVVNDPTGIHNPEVIFVNDELLPGQRFNIEHITKIDAWDRIRIILEIFKQRAVSEESKLQVELAGLRYEFPWIRELIHREKTGEHAGLQSGGEYQTHQYYTGGKRRERLIRMRLAVIERNREVMRSNRHRRGFVLASITGYTNAGKSTLFNALTEENVLVDDRMFATLATTTRRWGNRQPRILLTDTIGFIEDLPPWMIKAFNSTMEEVFRSDILILVIDVTDSHDEILRKVDTCLDMVSEERLSGQDQGKNQQHSSDSIQRIHPEDGPIIIPVLNKIDLLDARGIGERMALLDDAFPELNILPVSAKIKGSITELENRLRAAHGEVIGVKPIRIRVPKQDEGWRFINWVHENLIVLDQTESTEWREYDLDVPIMGLENFRKRLGKAMGKELVIESEPDECEPDEIDDYEVIAVQE